MESTLQPLPEESPWALWDKVRKAAESGQLPIFVGVMEDVTYWCRYALKPGSPLLHDDHRVRARTMIGVMVHTRADARAQIGLERD